MWSKKPKGTQHRVDGYIPGGVFCYCCMKWSADVNYIQFIDHIVEFNVFTDSLPAVSF